MIFWGGENRGCLTKNKGEAPRKTEKKEKNNEPGTWIPPASEEKDRTTVSQKHKRKKWVANLHHSL